jgi:hypothetical protein
MSDNRIGTDFEEPTPFAGTPRDAVVGTDFLTYATGSGANIQDQVSYDAEPQRQSGALPGIARSNFSNKAIRQGTFIAHSLSLWISQQLILYIYDDGNDVNWMANFTNALNQLILAAIPPGPNLGAYLPLIGGTMVGHIYFQPGITTILSNNTWYYGKDSGGTARGLILKGSDNNVYINDGSAPYVVMQGIPIISANNVALTGRNTSNTAYPLIGLLSDNSVHVGSGSAGNIFLDSSTQTGGSVWCATNFVISNNYAYYAKDTSGAARIVMMINTGNSLMIGSGAPNTTEIYAASGSNVNVHNPLAALTTFQAYGFSYLTGGRAYIPGGNDPWQIYADNGFFARTRFVVGGTRDWSVGVYPTSGLFSINDETGAAVRFQIDTTGKGTFFGAFYVQGGSQITGGLTVLNGLNVASGTISASGGASLSGGVSVYGGLSIVSGNTTMAGSLSVAANAQINGGLVVYNALNVASGRFDVAGGAYLAGGLQVWAGLAVNSGNVTMAGTLSVTGAATVGNGLSVYNGLNVASGNLSAGYIISTGAAQVNGGLTIYNGINIASGNLDVANTTFMHNQGQVWNHFYVQTGDMHVQNGSMLASGNANVGNTLFVSNQAQVWNWVIIQSGGLSVPNGDVNAAGNLSISGVGYIYAGLNVWSSLIVQTGNLTVNGAVGIGGGLTVYNGFNVQTGNAQVSNGSFSIAGDLNVGNTGYIRNQAQIWNHCIVQSGDLWVPNGSVGGNGNLNIGGVGNIFNSLNVWNSCVIQTGGFTVNGGAAIGSGLTVYNSINIVSGRFDVAGAGQINGGLTVGGGIYLYSGVGTCNSDWNVAGWSRGGGLWTDGDLHVGHYASLPTTHVGQIQIGGLPYMYDSGNNIFVMPNTNLSVAQGTIWGANLQAYGTVWTTDLSANGQITTNTCYAQYYRSYGAVDCDHVYAYNYVHADNYFDCSGWSYLRGGVQIWGEVYQFAGSFETYGHIYPVPNGQNECGVCQHQWRNVFSYNFATESDPAKKRDIAPVPEVCLELVNAIRPSTFKWRNPGTLDDHGQPMDADHPFANTHWGFMQPDVMNVMNDPDRKLPVFGGAYIDKMFGVKILQYNELVAVLWQAVRELSDKVKQLEATKH